VARLLAYYRQDVVPALQTALGRNNRLAVPRLEKICLNMGVGKAIDDSKLLDVALQNMATIAGQAATVTRARTSVSNFRLREGYRIGCRTTLRGARMYEFFDRLVNAAIPRIRDFRGLNPSAFDRAGNYSMGVEEVTIFPEIDADRNEQQMGMDITFVIRGSQGADESRELLKRMGMPFREN